MDNMQTAEEFMQIIVPACAICAAAGGLAFIREDRPHSLTVARGWRVALRWCILNNWCDCPHKQRLVCSVMSGRAARCHGALSETWTWTIWYSTVKFTTRTITHWVVNNSCHVRVWQFLACVAPRVTFTLDVEILYKALAPGVIRCYRACLTVEDDLSLLVQGYNKLLTIDRNH